MNYHNFGVLQNKSMSTLICNHIPNKNFIFILVIQPLIEYYQKTFDLIFQELQVYLKMCMDFDA
jgi:hypothetical protein